MTREEAKITLETLLSSAEDEDGPELIWTDKEAIGVAIEALKEEPRETAKWVFGTTMNRGWMKCSNCCVSQTPCGTFSYCPNCGRRMEGEQCQPKE